MGKELNSWIAERESYSLLASGAKLEVVELKIFDLLQAHSSNVNKAFGIPEPNDFGIPDKDSTKDNLKQQQNFRIFVEKLIVSDGMCSSTLLVESFMGSLATSQISHQQLRSTREILVARPFAKVDASGIFLKIRCCES